MYQAVLVDDEALILDNLQKSFDWNSYQFEIALATTEPHQALEYLRTHSVHLLIVDIEMPDINGLVLIQKAREYSPLVSIIVLSAYDNFNYVRPALRYGAENYLLKPLDTDELTETVNQILRHLTERQDFSDAFGSSMMNFRSSFVEHWTKNSLPAEELRKRALLLGIDMDSDNYTVCIFESLSLEESCLTRFFHEMLAYLPGHYRMYSYFEDLRQLVCIFTIPEGGAPADVLMDQLELMASRLELQVHYVCSPAVSSSHEVPFAYQNALSLLPLAFTQLPGIRGISPRKKNLWLSALIPLGETQPDDYTALLRQIFQGISSVSTLRDVCAFVSSHLICETGGNLREFRQNFPTLYGLLQRYPSAESSRDDYLTFLIELSRECFRLYSERNAQTSPYIEAVLAAIRNYSDTDISLKTLAAKLDISPAYLGTLFHQQTGYYFSDYLTRERILYAASLLRTTDRRLKTIIEMSGFSSQTYFNRVFKRYFGTSPLTYRRESRT